MTTKPRSRKKTRASQQTAAPKKWLAACKAWSSRHPVLLAIILLTIAGFGWFGVKPFISYQLAGSKASQLLSAIPLSGDKQIYAAAEDIGCSSHDTGWFGSTTSCRFGVRKIVAVKGDKKKLSTILHTLNTKLYEMGWEGYLSAGNIEAHRDFINGEATAATFLAQERGTKPRLNAAMLELPTKPYDYRAFTGLYGENEDPMPNLDGYNYLVLVEGLVYY